MIWLVPARDLREFYRDYEQAEVRAGRLDFEDRLVQTVELLETDAAAATTVRARKRCSPSTSTRTPTRSPSRSWSAGWATRRISPWWVIPTRPSRPSPAPRRSSRSTSPSTTSVPAPSRSPRTAAQARRSSRWPTGSRARANGGRCWQRDLADLRPPSTGTPTPRPSWALVPQVPFCSWRSALSAFGPPCYCHADV